jgi:hypothetical protein
MQQQHDQAKDNAGADPESAVYTRRLFKQNRSYKVKCMWIHVIGTDREQIAYIIRVREALRSAQKEATRRGGHTCGCARRR